MGVEISLYSVVTEEEGSSHIPHLLVRKALNLGRLVAHSYCSRHQAILASKSILSFSMGLLMKS